MQKLKEFGLLGELAAEFLATSVLIMIGCGAVAQVVAGGDSVGNYNTIAWSWGLGVTLAIYIASRTSGAHINPAVTVAFATFGDFPWRKVPLYVVAQTFGAFVGALVVRVGYADLLAAADPGHTSATQGVFSTMPGNGTLPVSVMGAFTDQIIGTAILVLLIFAIVDRRNTSPAANLAPFMIGLIVVAIGMAWGANAGYAINPARDFGPRLASYLTGYATAFTDPSGYPYFWVPIVAPVIGGLIGAAIYIQLIARFLPPPPHPDLDAMTPHGEQLKT
ncbi:MIP/aquaporin family protein [Rhodococcus marinonascens]|uniref:MIP/aquaporin family protein n=1 Tax=Rhodococcus marinonascens TaxID=38311 RepID=UPI0009325A58|nr:MIP family channel protein [Rhodococcus marinonascens]